MADAINACFNREIIGPQPLRAPKPEYLFLLYTGCPRKLVTLLK